MYVYLLSRLLKIWWHLLQAVKFAAGMYSASNLLPLLLHCLSARQQLRLCH
jgi:hypothetical protein